MTYGDFDQQAQREPQTPPAAGAPGRALPPVPYTGQPQATGAPASPPYPAVPSPYKDTTVAYLLWFFLASFGAHAFYLRQPGKAVTMLVLTLVGWATVWLLIGILPLLAVAIIWIVDAFLIPGRVRELNLRIGSVNAAAAAQLGHRPY